MGLVGFLDFLCEVFRGSDVYRWVRFDFDIEGYFVFLKIVLLLVNEKIRYFLKYIKELL